MNQIIKQVKISEKIYHRLRTTGSQQAVLYGLAKVHKRGTPLRPVLSKSGSGHENLKKSLSPFFRRLPGAIVETNWKDARAALQATKLDEVKLAVFLNVKSLYTNEPIEEATEIDHKDLYSSDEVPEFPRSAMKSLSRLAVTSVHFKCIRMWYTQTDGLAIGASLAVILANLWMKSFKKSLQRPNEGRESVTFEGKAIECESC